MMTEAHDRRGSGFNDKQFHELHVAVRAEVADVNSQILDQLEAMRSRLNQGDTQMKDLAEGIRQNNASTAEMRDMFETAKKGLAFLGTIGSGLKWIAGLIATASGIYTVLKGWHTK